MSTSAEQDDSSSCMVCADCFRAKGESSLFVPCRNQKCCFYTTSERFSTMEVNTQQSGTDSGEWRRGEGSMGHRTETSSESPRHSSFSLMRSRAYVSTPGDSCVRVKSDKMHNRVMSVPSTGGFFLQDDTDLVEEAFLSSPLSTAANRIELGRVFMSGTNGGSAKPFKKPGCMLDWLYVKPASISSAPKAFDMTSLKLELPSAVPLSPSLEDGSARSSPISSSKSRTSLPSPNLFALETYSKKVFIGGLPQDVDEDDIWTYFLRFGSLTVDWPHKSHTRGSIPPKGYAFLLFKEEISVHNVLKACICEGDKFFLHIPTISLGRKKIQVRPWCTADSQCLLDSRVLDQRKAVFVGGVPRPLKASELAQVMNEKYGNVAFVAIDCDLELKYPKGAACVVFMSHSSYIAAVSARFMQLSYGDMDKKIEIKPYVLDGQQCDECHGVQCDGKPAPFFCSSITCLKYYCEHCWATVHTMPNWQNHRPLLKDIGEHARFH